MGRGGYPQLSMISNCGPVSGVAMLSYSLPFLWLTVTIIKLYRCGVGEVKVSVRTMYPFSSKIVHQMKRFFTCPLSMIK